MDYKGLSEQLVKSCLKQGADQAEVYIKGGRNLRIVVRNGEIETVQESSAHGVGFRVFIKGKTGFSYCNDFTKTAMEKTIQSAVRFAKITTADKNNVLPGEMEVTEVNGLYDPDISKIQMDKKVGLAKKIEELATKDRRITKSAGARYSEGETEIFIANSHGLLKNYRMSSCSLGVSVVAEKGEQKSTGSEYCTRRFFSDLKSTEDIAAKAAEKAYKMLDHRMIKTQRAMLIVDPDAARSILGGIRSAVNGERVLQGASFLRDKMDQKIASNLVTIIDDGTRPGGMGSKPFDGEGVATRKRIIVDHGIIKGFMYNTAVAHRAGVKSTGNASRGGFRRLPGIGTHNFYMESGESTQAGIIEDTKRGLLLKGVTGYGINPVNGNFSGGASGFWVENGNISFPVKRLTIAGTAHEMLTSIDRVGNDLDMNKSFTAPTFRIQEIQIGGD